MTSSAWSPYRPTPDCALEPRAGLDAPPPGRVRRDLGRAPARPGRRPGRGRRPRARRRVPHARASPPTSPRTADLLGDAATGSSDARRLQAWWLYRMLFTPDPLLERLTLMWHDHFATSQLKVDDVAAMRRQNETFRRHARGPFGDLLRAMLRDPALLDLARRPVEPQGEAQREPGPRADGAVHARRRPLHRGRREGSRPGPDRLHGRAGAVPGPRRSPRRRREDDPRQDRPVRRRLARRPSARTSPRWPTGWPGGSARRSWAKGSPTPRPGASWPIGSGATTCTSAGPSRRSSARRSSSRQQPARAGSPTRSASPSARCGRSSGSIRRPARCCWPSGPGRMGQELFFPPNVGGWPGGRSWLSGRAVVARANFAAALASGSLNSDATPPDLRGLAARHGRGQAPREAHRLLRRAPDRPSP